MTYDKIKEFDFTEDETILDDKKKIEIKRFEQNLQLVFAGGVGGGGVGGGLAAASSDGQSNYENLLNQQELGVADGGGGGGDFSF